MQESNRLFFATSNDHKFEEARLALRRRGILLRRLRAKGEEIQSDDVREIAKRAALEAFRAERRPLFVEDTGLFVRALGGFPGAYASYVNRTLGPASLIALLRRGERRDAEFVSAVAYCDRVSKVSIFTGRLEGEIANSARGDHGFGFDPVFVPAGTDRTLAEMSMREKGEVSHRARALDALADWLLARRAGQHLSA